MENDIITGVLALISTIATGGLGAALARVTRQQVARLPLEVKEVDDG